ncbi:MAG: glycosyltransferase [Pseudomonadota bacterium]
MPDVEMGAPEVVAMPLVSVYMPTHNRLALLRRAVSSVLAQSMTDLELIIVNDQSSDGTADYLDELAASNPRVRVLHNTGNLGACASRNRAIAVARGEYVTGLDDDDFFLPERLSSFLRRWAAAEVSEPTLKGLYSNVYFMTRADGGGRATQVLPRVTRTDLQRRNHVGNHVFTKTRYLKAIGGFDPAFPAWQDYDTWYRLAESEGSLLADPGISYVVDESHDNERISAASLARFERAHHLFCAKHALPDHVVATLRNSVFQHPLARMTLRDLWQQIRAGDVAIALRVFLLKSRWVAWRSMLMPRPMSVELMQAVLQRLEARA